MKVVIDIDKEKYERIKKNNPNVDIDSIVGAVANGIPYEERPQGDVISRQAAKDRIKAICEKYHLSYEDGERKVSTGSSAYALGHAFDDLPPLKPQGEWIPIKYRPLTEEERIAFAEHYGVDYCDTLEEKAFDCPMPESGQSILISTSWGVVEDVADNDIDGEGFICYGLEINGDWDGVDAWMPKPESYKKGGEEE